ncbi:MAG TPA: hypothetical protein VFT04_11675 [Gemmatimonadales bacterium]|nr:hypothetical protein [Gemmatimonadales bacterium]
MSRALMLALAGALSIAIVSALPATPAAYRSGGRAGLTGLRTDSTAPYRTRLRANFALVSVAGLPPVLGRLLQSAGSIVFQPVEGGEPVVFPLFKTAGGSRRTPAVRLLEAAGDENDSLYLFHLGNAVVETATPGILGELVTEPARVDDLGSAWTTEGQTLAPRRDREASLAVIRELTASPYADSVFFILGEPMREIGVVDGRGVRAGRLGEYLSRRDSIALSPSYMTSNAQLRHALAHELAHRWLREHPESARQLAATMHPMRDSLRYGYHDRQEQLAEAVAFAVHFLQVTARTETADPTLLDSYERLVPGTREAARLIITSPAYELHPLARGVTLAKASD